MEMGGENEWTGFAEQEKNKVKEHGLEENGKGHRVDRDAAVQDWHDKRLDCSGKLFGSQKEVRAQKKIMIPTLQSNLLTDVPFRIRFAYIKCINR